MNAATSINGSDFLQNKLGHLVPITAISEIDLLRDQTVRELYQTAQKLQNYTIAIKQQLLSDFSEFVELAFEQHEARFGGEKGNITLTSYDGMYKVQLVVATHMQFNEQLQAAKQLIDKCLLTWTQDSDSKVQALVTHAFQVENGDKISTQRVLALTRIKIEDDDWKRAMTAIFASLEPSGKSTYMRFFYRPDKGKKYETLVLDFSKLPFATEPKPCENDEQK